MTLIRETLERDLSQRIEEIIKLDQQDEQVVYQEITEYVATPDIRHSYRTLLEAIATAPAQPSERVGVWVSGFFGSGKSSFAKNLGYMLANRTVCGHPAGQLLAKQLGDQRITELIEYINRAMPTEVIMFDVMADSANKPGGTQPIAEIVYTVLLRQLDYAEDFNLAELEIELEAEGKLERFEQAIYDRYAADVGLIGSTPHEVWQRVRKGAQSISRASVALHDIDPNSHPTPDSFVQSVRAAPARVTINIVVERIFELMKRRRPGKGVVFIIDEVGQYVARSSEKIEDLRAFVEQLGKTGRNLAAAKKIPAPAWLVVTSQEKLDEVVAAIDAQRVELARLQDRFHYRVDLAPADIKTVATKRVLGKNAFGEELLARYYAENEGQLNTHTHLERTARQSDISQQEFIQFYPYLPHFIDLSIDIVSGIRLQPGAPKHIGGSNRTIIKQAYEMLVNERTNMANRPVGDLVTLDLIYELVEGNLSTEKRRDIADIAERFAADPWPCKVAKAIALLEFVRDLPRSEGNLAALLYPRLGAPSVRGEVRNALALLEEHQYIRRIDDGYKLQTQQEKSWETKRNSLEVTTKELNEVLRETIRKIAEERVQPYRHPGGRTFRAEISLDGVSLGTRGQIPIDFRIAADEVEARELIDQATFDSRQTAHRNQAVWIVTLTTALRNLQTEVIRSRKMVSEYEQLRAQGQLSAQESGMLADEKQRLLSFERRLQEQLANAMAGGTVVFRGLNYDGSILGDTLESAMRALLEQLVPQLYPKLELGAMPVKGTEAEEILKAANLNALPQIFYAPPAGLGLVTRDAAGRNVVDTNAEIAREVLNYLQQQHTYGEKVTGRMLETHFTGIGYGWDPDVIRVVLAALLRAGAIEVTYQGRRYRNHADPLARAPFTGTQAFRAASFAPREQIDLKTLVAAAENLEQLTGHEVDIEEEEIATRLKELAQGELQKLGPVDAQISANHLPRPAVLQEYRDTLQGIMDAPSDDCVRILAGEGRTLLDQRGEVHQIRDAVSPANLPALLGAQRALRELWPEVPARVPEPGVVEAAELLRERFASGEIYAERAAIVDAASQISQAHERIYADLHERRRAAYAQAIEEIQARTEWQDLLRETDAATDHGERFNLLRQSILGDLERRACESRTFTSLENLADARRCPSCRASLSEMESDLDAVGTLKSRALERLWQALNPEPPEVPSKRLRVSDIARGPIASEEDLDRFLADLREEIIALLATGGRVIVE